MDAYTACRVIMLDKHPGVRSIGVYETVYRIIGKAILSVIKFYVLEVAGYLQLCAGQQAGAETAVHALCTIFECRTLKVVLVDAKNAFNCLNREATFLNMHSICPPLARIVTNYYHVPSALYTSAAKILWFCEGTTQGKPLGMVIYAMRIMTLIHHLHDRNRDVGQILFADNSAGTSNIAELRMWWDDLRQNGPTFGYHPNFVTQI